MHYATAPPKRKRDHGSGHFYKRCRCENTPNCKHPWWIQIRWKGRRYRESTQSNRKSDAVKLFKQRLAEQSAGTFNPKAEDVTFADLADMLRTNYKLNQRRSLDRAERAITHLEASLGDTCAVDITYERIERYALNRGEEGAAPATVRNELAALKFMFSLATKARRLNRRPAFPSIKVDNARKGFFEEEDFAALHTELPVYLKNLFAFAYHTGWRVKSEIVPLRWHQVDFNAGVVRLEPGTTKNGEGRTFPFGILPELAKVLESQKRYTRLMERRIGRRIPYVFHRNGNAIKDYRSAWRNACKRAKLIGRIPHDFRRTAVRNLERAGVSRSVAMQLVGHKTESIYQRYAITNEQDLKDGVAKLAKMYQPEQTAETKVLPLARKANAG
jgi:integrase